MLTKEKIKNTVDMLPEQFTLEDLIEELIVIHKIEEGSKDIEEGRFFTADEVKHKLSKLLS